VNTDELARLLEQYRLGIEAELNLLHQLSEISHQQRQVTHSGDLGQFGGVADERDRLMRSLVTIEEDLRPVRQALADHRELANNLPGFDDVLGRHREAAQLVSAIMSTDQASLSSLADAELARRSAVASLERGETTLAAYRRVLAPPVASATLLNRRG
jgi:hypothetical protein